MCFSITAENHRVSVIRDSEYTLVTLALHNYKRSMIKLLTSTATPSTANESRVSHTKDKIDKGKPQKTESNHTIQGVNESTGISG